MSNPAHHFYQGPFINNLRKMQNMNASCGVNMLVAFKGYIPWHSGHLMKGLVSGVAVSSLNEAIAASNFFDCPIHTYCPVYIPSDFDALVDLSDVMVFNSMSEYFRYEGRTGGVEIDLRINPQHVVVNSTVFDGYNPNKPFSRFGVTINEMPSIEHFKRTNITGLHFHGLNCQGSGDLVEMLKTIEKNFGEYLSLPQVVRFNMGGGHAFTKLDYDLDLLYEAVWHLQSTYGVSVFMEPSEYVYKGCGVLEATVLDIIHNEVDIALLNVSAKNHMPDILESPYYFAPLQGAEYQGSGPYSYILAGNTCLTGDVIGSYSFEEPLRVGQKLRFLDQVAYTSVQSTFFNGVNKPDQHVYDPQGDLLHLREFGYDDFLSTI